MSDFEKYATRIIRAWLDNSEEYYTRYKARAAEILKANHHDKEAATEILADEIHEDLRRESPAGDTGVYADLIEEALDNVDFSDVANSFLD